MIGPSFCHYDHVLPSGTPHFWQRHAPGQMPTIDESVRVLPKQRQKGKCRCPSTTRQVLLYDSWVAQQQATTVHLAVAILIAPG